MLKEIFKNIQALAAFIAILAAMITPTYFAYKVGFQNGARKMASYYPEIRRQAVINALAPRVKDE